MNDKKARWNKMSEIAVIFYYSIYSAYLIAFSFFLKERYYWMQFVEFNCDYKCKLPRSVARCPHGGITKKL
jgi:hypothetical protein